MEGGGCGGGDRATFCRLERRKEVVGCSEVAGGVAGSVRVFRFLVGGAGVETVGAGAAAGAKEAGTLGEVEEEAPWLAAWRADERVTLGDMSEYEGSAKHLSRVVGRVGKRMRGGRLRGKEGQKDRSRRRGRKY